jgi:hypothetical protein
MRRNLWAITGIVLLSLLFLVPSASARRLMWFGMGSQNNVSSNFLLVNTGVKMLVNTGNILKIQ